MRDDKEIILLLSGAFLSSIMSSMAFFWFGKEGLWGIMGVIGFLFLGYVTWKDNS